MYSLLLCWALPYILWNRTAWRLWRISIHIPLWMFRAFSIIIQKKRHTLKYMLFLVHLFGAYQKMSVFWKAPNKLTRKSICLRVYLFLYYCSCLTCTQRPSLIKVENACSLVRTRQILNTRWKFTYSVTELLIVVTVIGSNMAFLLLNKENDWEENSM